jgi:hypothetical protein
MEKKRLRKAEIALLWYATDGHCADCQQPLDPAAWRTVWRTAQPVTRPPNVHDMCAVCAPCATTRRLYLIPGFTY